MNHREVAGLMAAIAPTIGDFVGKAIAPLRAENDRLSSIVAGLEKRIAEFAFPQDLQTVIAAEVGKVVSEVVPGEVEAAVGKIEKPKDGLPGKSVTVEEVRPILEELVAALPLPAPGRDADPVDVAALIVDDVAKLIPPPKNGESVTVEQLLPFLEEMVGKAVGAIPQPLPGKDGVGLAGALIDRGGELVLTLSDGSTKALGIVVGKDADQAEILAFIQEKIAALPKPENGKDGLGFDDLEATFDGERTIGFKFVRGEQVKEFTFKMPVVLDRGVYKEEKSYERGDGVTFGGSFWIAQKDAPEGKPQDGSRDWRLSVKKGRNGADGIVKTLPPPGPVKSS